MFKVRITTMMGLALVLGLAGAARAQSPAVTIDDLTGLSLGNPPFTLGFSFTANVDAKVTALGIFDDRQDGLVDRYEMGLWDSVGNLMATTIVASGTSSPLTNQWRYSSISAVLLSAGAQYAVGGLYTTGNDPLIFPGLATNFAANPMITFGESRFAPGGALANPTSTGGSDPSYFGANMLISAVPEPGSMALLAGMLIPGAVLVYRRRKR